MLQFLEFITGVFVVVYDGQHGLRFTLGRAGDIVGPGVHFKIPILQQYRVEDTRHTTLDLEPQVIQLRDELVYEVDAKLIYQIVDVRKAVVEVDDLVVGLRNRVSIAVQQILKMHDRHSILDVPALVAQVQEAVAPIAEQWGVRVVEFGFSNISPSQATLEITQMALLAAEKHRLFQEFVGAGMRPDEAVALISGAVVALPGVSHAAP